MKNDLREKSRKLWEEVFPEDTPKFLDYYNRYVADHNRIYMDEEEDGPVSMLHMNPYRICAAGREAAVNYIVAVATRKQFRHQGRMRHLLKQALEDSWQREEPFAFLMPASEAIYRPFGFKTVRWQDVITLGGPFFCEEREDQISCRYAKKEDLPDLAELSQRILQKNCAVFAKRDTDYYRRIWEEQTAVEGGILLLHCRDKLWGYCFTGQEEGTEIWELSVESRDGESREQKAGDYARALQAVTGMFAGKGPIKVRGLLPGAEIAGISLKEIAYRPITMVRIVNLPAFARLLRSAEKTEQLLLVKDDFLKENSGYFRLQTDRNGGRLIHISKEEGSGEHPVEVTIEELTEVCFGLRRNKDIPVCPLHPVYFNELV